MLSSFMIVFPNCYQTKKSSFALVQWKTRYRVTLVFCRGVSVIAKQRHKRLVQNCLHKRLGLGAFEDKELGCHGVRRLNGICQLDIRKKENVLSDHVHSGIVPCHGTHVH